MPEPKPYVLAALLVTPALLILAVALLASNYLRTPKGQQPDYFDWFLLHFGIGALGIIAVIFLAFTTRLDSAAAAILSSIIGYSLGAVRSGKGAAPPSQPTAGTPPTGQSDHN